MQERPYGATGGAPCKHLGALAGKEGLPFSLGSINSTGGECKCFCAGFKAEN